MAMVAIRPRRPSRLAADLGLSRPAIARQLRLLADAGLIEGHRVVADGRGVLYLIDPRRHGQITAWLAGTEIGLPIEALAPAPGVRGLVRRPRPDDVPVDREPPASDLGRRPEGPRPRMKSG